MLEIIKQKEEEWSEKLDVFLTKYLVDKFNLEKKVWTLYKYIFFLILSCGLIYLVLFINTNSFKLLLESGLTKGFVYASLLGGIIIAPAVEEYAKRISVLCNCALLFGAMFIGYEFFEYVKYGVPVSFRIPAILMHTLTILIQKVHHNKAKLTGNKYLSRQGYYVSVFIHSLFNMSYTVFI